MARKTKTVPSSLSDLLTEDIVRSLADPGSWNRAQAYVRDGSITNVLEFDNRITADAWGQHHYRVELWLEEGGDLGYDCTCPAGADIGFCKHCIATALIRINEYREEKKTTKDKKRRKSKTTIEDVREYLLSLSKEQLVEIAVDRMRIDAAFRANLMTSAAMSTGAGFGPLREELKNITYHRGFIDYYESFDYAHDVLSVVGVMREALSEETAVDMMALCEEGLDWVSEALGHADDSNGDIGSVLADLQQIHLEAALLAMPEPVALAERLFEMEMKSEWEVFYDAGKTYTKVLGKKGTKRYDELVLQAWDALPPLKQGEFRWGEKRWHLETLVKRIAAHTRDDDLLLSILQKNQESPESLIELARYHWERGDREKTFELMEDRASASNPEGFIVDELIRFYIEAGEKEKGMELLWSKFVRNPSVGNYKALTAQGAKWRVKTGWRDRAFDYLQEVIVEEKRDQLDNYVRSQLKDGSLLVQLYLLEKKPEKAWEFALEYGCSNELWLQLAEGRATTHPEDALVIWQEQLEDRVEATNKAAYSAAFDLLLKTEALLTSRGRREEFLEYLEDLYAKYKVKRTFAAMLKKKWKLT